LTEEQITQLQEYLKSDDKVIGGIFESICELLLEHEKRIAELESKPEYLDLKSGVEPV
jgi:glycine cleavage system regulatory protein